MTKWDKRKREQYFDAHDKEGKNMTIQKRGYKNDKVTMYQGCTTHKRTMLRGCYDCSIKDLPIVSIACRHTMLVKMKMINNFYFTLADERNDHRYANLLSI